MPTPSELEDKIAAGNLTEKHLLPGQPAARVELILPGQETTVWKINPELPRECSKR